MSLFRFAVSLLERENWWHFSRNKKKRTVIVHFSLAFDAEYRAWQIGKNVLTGAIVAWNVSQVLQAKVGASDKVEAKSSTGENQMLRGNTICRGRAKQDLPSANLMNFLFPNIATYFNKVSSFIVAHSAKTCQLLTPKRKLMSTLREPVAK